MTPHPSPVPGHAAVDYVQRHHATVCRIISSRLGSRLRQVFSTEDIEQSLLRVLLQQRPPSQPLTEDALGRLVTVILLRLIRQKLRKEHLSRWSTAPTDLDPGTGADADPGEQVAARDFIAAIQPIAGKDWPLVEARLEGRTFEELAGQFGLSPDALRMRFNRALDSIRRQLEVDHD